jgi:glucose/arabinose dehydrogenase
MALLLRKRTLYLLTLLPLLGAGAALGGGGCDSDTGAGGAGTSSPSSSSGGGSTTSAAGGAGAGGAGGSTGAGGTIDCGAMASGPAPALRLTQVAAGLRRPLFVAAAPGDNDRLFVVEQAGTIQVVMGGVLQQPPFLDIDALIDNPSGADEWGLLGLAFHPDYAQNRRFFVFYIPSDGDSVVVEYLRSEADPNVAEPSPVQTLLTITGGGGHHYGGMMAFGRDGYLYISSGDRGEGNSAQDLNDQRGKILRMDVDNPGTPPPGNLPNADPLVWDYGLRNPWRFSVDRCNGDIYIGDVGEAYEEINAERGGQGHKNYGWPDNDTGTQCMSGTCPVWAIDHNRSDCSVIAGYVYRGTGIPNMNGRFLHGDWCTNRIRSFAWDGGSAIALEEDLTANLESDALIAIASFGEDNEGNMYVVDLGDNGPSGAVYRIDPE